MQRYICGQCGAEIFFQNDLCLGCGKGLGFDPTSLEMRTLEVLEDGLLRPVPGPSEQRFKLCANGTEHAVCNWLIPEQENQTYCAACRLNEIIPDLTVPANLERWRKIELAKRRCVYSLLRFHLPLDGKGDETGPLKFRFLSAVGEVGPVFTGHLNGCITLNIAEADDHEREKVRAELHEPYRTLVGHFRHEMGHYYWDRLIKAGPFLNGFRSLFGDERPDYSQAMRQYYQSGPGPDWQLHHVTPYSSAHPWEDWAETWAHYFHIVHATRIADSFGIQVTVASPAEFQDEFGQLCNRWIQLSCAFNAVNRGMGLNDLYPFVLTPNVIQKLRFVDTVVKEQNPG